MALRRKCCHLLVFAFVLSGCGDPVKNAGELVGTWKLKEECREFLPESMRNGHPEVVLSSTGEFEARDWPMAFNFISTEWEYSFLSGKGTWKLDRKDDRQAVQMLFVSISKGTASKGSFGDYLEIDRARGKLTLYMYLSDPDSAPRIEFECTK
jgi:hypothetical protein